MAKHFRVIFLILICTLIFQIKADNFNNNFFNKHGMVGLINTPTARLLDESSYGISIYYGDPDSKLTFTAFPFDWLEASVFYSSFRNSTYCDDLTIDFCTQDQIDKGFNFKVRVLEETKNTPSIAIGINDAGGTGYYNSEYIVGSYGIGDLDMHFGIGWCQYNGKSDFSNPLGKLHPSFYERSDTGGRFGGEFSTSSFFSGDTASYFFGLSYLLSEKVAIKFERDPQVVPGRIGFENSNSDFNLGLNFSIKNNFDLSLSLERGNYFSLGFSYKSPKVQRPSYKYKRAEYSDNDTKYKKFIRNLNKNGIGVNEIFENSEQIGVQLTQFTHPNLNIIDEIIKRASYDAGLEKPIKKDLRIADLEVITEYDEEFVNNANLIYQRKASKNFFTNTKLTFRPFLASREAFIKGAVLLENDSEIIIRDNLFFTTNLKYSIADNFDDLTIPPVNTYPAQVRSDVKDYLRNYDDGVFIGRAQFDYHITPKRNHYLMASAGILEDMFLGAGFEYLFYKSEANYAAGFEIFNVKKRDYKMRFGTLDYENTVGSINFYYRNYNSIPFDAKVSYGEYLAGDIGTTIELSRRFNNGVMFGIFVSNTDVSADQFGEGSFDKGIFFDIPIFGNLVSYSWRPLTKDPGQKLIRKHTLYDLLVKFKPIN